MNSDRTWHFLDRFVSVCYWAAPLRAMGKVHSLSSDGRFPGSDGLGDDPEFFQGDGGFILGMG